MEGLVVPGVAAEVADAEGAVAVMEAVEEVAAAVEMQSLHRKINIISTIKGFWLSARNPIESGMFNEYTHQSLSDHKYT